MRFRRLGGRRLDGRGLGDSEPGIKRAAPSPGDGGSDPGSPPVTPQSEIAWDDGDFMAWDDGSFIAWD